MIGKMLLKVSSHVEWVDQTNPVRMGSKSQDPYLAHCTASSEKRGIEKSVLEADTGMINRILSSECAALIITIKLSGPDVEPSDRLTAAPTTLAH